MKDTLKAFNIKIHSCNCERPKATTLERTNGSTVDAWASNLCLECYLQELYS
jgi:hypothetical protein